MSKPERFVLRSLSGRYVTDMQSGIMYGARDQAVELSQADVDLVRSFMPDGPGLIVEPVETKP